MLTVKCTGRSDADVERLLRDALAKPLGEDDSALARRLRKNHHELLAAVARHDVDLAHGLLEQRAELAQHAVAGEVARGVVDRLEVVDVEQQQRERRVEPPRAIDLGRQPIEQRAAIEHARERIGRRQRLEPAVVGARRLERLRAANRRHRRADHDVGELDVLGRQRALVATGAQKEHARRASDRS